MQWSGPGAISWIRGLSSWPLLSLIGMLTQFSYFLALFFLSPLPPRGWRNSWCFSTNLWYVLWCFPTVHLHFIIINIHATSKLNDWILLWKQTLNIVILMTFGYFHFKSKKTFSLSNFLCLATATLLCCWWISMVCKWCGGDGMGSRQMSNLSSFFPAGLGKSGYE